MCTFIRRPSSAIWSADHIFQKKKTAGQPERKRQGNQKSNLQGNQNKTTGQPEKKNGRAGTKKITGRPEKHLAGQLLFFI
jgi:hypothetical protein